MTTECSKISVNVLSRVQKSLISHISKMFEVSENNFNIFKDYALHYTAEV
jgi:hypothetical protein